MAPSSRIPAPLAPALSPTSPSTRPLRPAHFVATNAPQTSPPPTPLRPRWRGPLSSSPSHHAARSLPRSSSEGKGREEKREREKGRRRPSSMFHVPMATGVNCLEKIECWIESSNSGTKHKSDCAYVATSYVYSSTISGLLPVLLARDIWSCINCRMAIVEHQGTTEITMMIFQRSRALWGDQRLAVHATGHVNQANYHSKTGSMMLGANVLFLSFLPSNPQLSGSWMHLLLSAAIFIWISRL
nr:uncharacterized protein LOC109773221 [Aegilops tauschii subsp. strangulata]